MDLDLPFDTVRDALGEFTGVDRRFQIRGEARGITAFASANVETAATEADISADALEHLAARFADAGRALAIPGGSALAQSNGLDLAGAVLALNALVGALGREGGVFLSAVAPLTDAYHAPASSKEKIAFIERLNSGRVKTLFVHGSNPVFDLPKA